MEGVKKTMEKAVTEFLKVAQRDSLWVHEDDAGRSQIVSTFRSGFAEGRVTVTESSRSQEILHFEVSDVFQAVVLVRSFFKDFFFYVSCSCIVVARS